MAHECPECGLLCHCGGDIDDICFGLPDHYCTCCDYDDGDWDEDDYLEEQEQLNDSINQSIQ